MLLIRTTVCGGILLLAVQASAGPFPLIPRRIFVLMRIHSVSDRIKPKFVNPPADVDTVRAVANSSVPAKPGPQSVNPPPSILKIKSPTLEWLDDNIFGRIDVAGSRTLGFHAYSVSGDVDTFNTTNNFGEGGQTWTSDGELQLTGKKVLGVASFQATIQDNRLSDPTNQQLLIEYDKGPLKLSEGDIRGSLLNTNHLATFAKSLHGSMAEYQQGPFHIKALYSETKGSPRTIQIAGSNSAGPYFLESGKLLTDTLQVLVDGIAQRPGVDFVADSQAGSITFLSKVISATSTIVASFEAVAPGTSPGVLSGVGASYDFGRYGRIGVNIVRQTATGIGTDGLMHDSYQFAGPSATTYLLSAEPVLSTLIVQLGDIILTQGTDYTVNAAENRQIILSSTLGGIIGQTTLFVRYKPIVVASIVGDREVFGLDYSLKLGKQGLIQYDQAMGHTINSSSPTGATARELTATYTIGRLKLNSVVKDIPNDYVSIDTQGFNRNEKSYDIGATMTQNRLTYGTDYSNAVIANQTTTSLGATEIQNARSTSAKAFAQYVSADGSSLALTQTRTSGHLLYDSRLDDTALTATKGFGKLRVDTGLEYQQGIGPLLDSSGVTKVGSVYMDTYHVTLRYVPTSTWNVDSRASVSQVRALGQTSTGEDISVGSTWKPDTRWMLSGALLHSISGQASVLSGFSNGTGYGYSGNGFSSGSLGSGYLGAADGTLDQQSLNLTFKSSDRLTLDAHLANNRSTGTLSANSSVHDLGAGAEVDLGKLTIASLYFDRTTTDFINSSTGSSGHADSNSVNFSIGGAPKGPWSYQLAVSAFISGGTSAYNQNSVNYNTSVGYRLTRKQQLTLAYLTGTYTGYQGQRDEQIVASYSYSLLQHLALSASYRIHTVTNSDPTVTTGAYRAAGFDVQLTFGYRP